jgi:hypothetical protein
LKKQQQNSFYEKTNKHFEAELGSAFKAPSKGKENFIFFFPFFFLSFNFPNCFWAN